MAGAVSQNDLPNPPPPPAGGVWGTAPQAHHPIRLAFSLDTIPLRPLQLYFDSPTTSDELGFPQLSTGDTLRAAVKEGSDVGKQAESVMQSGGLVSDELVVGIITDRIKKDDCRGGLVLDGFPRTVQQAELLDKMLLAHTDIVTKVISLDVPDSVLEEPSSTADVSSTPTSRNPNHRALSLSHV